VRHHEQGERRARLHGLVKRIGKVDGISFLLRQNAQAVTLAIHDICWKAGYNLVCNGFLSAVYTGFKGFPNQCRKLARRLAAPLENRHFSD
jgi:hypothetical protein